MLFRSEDEGQEGHHQHAAADAQQAGQKAGGDAQRQQIQDWALARATELSAQL